MKITHLFYFLITSLAVSAQQEPINREWFYIGTGITHSIEDQAIGTNWKIGLPMQKGFYFNAQASYFPNILKYNYTEFRYEFNVELTLFTIKKYSVYANAGFNYGRWSRMFTAVNLPQYGEATKDRSLLFGGGMEYKIKRIKIFAEFKNYHEIGRNHISAGIKYQFFESKELRKSYLNYLKNKSKQAEI